MADREFIEKAYANVVRLHEQFKQGKDTKLALRYTLLRHYFEARLPAWRASKPQ